MNSPASKPPRAVRHITHVTVFAENGHMILGREYTSCDAAYTALDLAAPAGPLDTQRRRKLRRVMAEKGEMSFQHNGKRYVFRLVQSIMQSR